jgi:hypothetical protein
MTTLAQRRILRRAKRWADEVPRAKSVPDKRRAVRKVLDNIYLLFGARPPTDLERLMDR